MISGVVLCDNVLDHYSNLLAISITRISFYVYNKGHEIKTTAAYKK
jgi:hypothetical protein